jgi:hypothetical protein
MNILFIGKRREERRWIIHGETSMQREMKDLLVALKLILSQMNMEKIRIIHGETSMQRETKDLLAALKLILSNEDVDFEDDDRKKKPYHKTR